MGYLVVDDQKAARTLLRVFLIRLGADFVEESADSISALRLIMLTPPNLCPFKAVFVSRTMPEMSGLEFVRTVRQLPGWSSFPIVVVSEDAEPALEDEAFVAGASDYILRPYSEEDLANLLNRLNS